MALTIRQRHAVLEGHSAAANKLITAMAAEPGLRNAAFAAPVLRGENVTDVFTIQVDLEGAP
jgi:hypothetical protein